MKPNFKAWKLKHRIKVDMRIEWSNVIRLEHLLKKAIKQHPERHL